MRTSCPELHFSPELHFPKWRRLIVFPHRPVFPFHLDCRVRRVDCDGQTCVVERGEATARRRGSGAAHRSPKGCAYYAWKWSSCPIITPPLARVKAKSPTSPLPGRTRRSPCPPAGRWPRAWADRPLRPSAIMSPYQRVMPDVRDRQRERLRLFQLPTSPPTRPECAACRPAAQSAGPCLSSSKHQGDIAAQAAHGSGQTQPLRQMRQHRVETV